MLAAKRLTNVWRSAARSSIKISNAGKLAASRSVMTSANSSNWNNSKSKDALGLSSIAMAGAIAMISSMDNVLRSDTMEVFHGDEIKKHNTPEDCWIVIQNKVYDLTEFFKLHPGGAQIMLPFMGRDATKAFSQVKSPEELIYHLTNEKMVGVMISDMDDDDIEPIAEEDLQRLLNIINKPKLDNIFSLLDFEYVAKKILPITAYTYYATGSDDEFTMRENHYAYKRVFFKPRVLNDTSTIDLSTEIMGTKVDIPVYITAFAGSKMAHPLGELNLMHASYKENIFQMVPIQLSMPFRKFMDEVPEDHHQWAQLHFYSDQEIKNSIKHFQRFEKEKTIKGVFVNADIAALGNREKDDKVRVAYDKSGTLKEFTSHDVPRPTLTWSDIARFQTETKLPLCLKGVQNADDVLKAAEMGINAVVISNHGGRQLDFSQPSLEVLAESKRLLKAKGLDGKIDIFIDGGIKRGSDIIKALCLGAKGVGLGRPFLYSMAAYGEEGVVRTIQILKKEMERDMKLLGVSKIEDLNESFVDARGLNLRSNGSDDRLYNNAYEPIYFPRFNNE